ncbi:hypothetical protein, partial [Limnobacter sp.]|uniref:hypothetical protein n=1 Tax=Limnobacter sp. TaxID=2003368 RepID=UPI004037CCB8
AVFNGQSALANFPHWATHDRVHRPIGGGVSIASPSRKPALACRAVPVLPSMGDRERTRPAFWRAVLRHREAQQGEYRFSGERSEPKPIGRLRKKLRDR